MSTSKRESDQKDKKTIKKNKSSLLNKIADNLSIWNKAGPSEDENPQGWTNLSEKGREAALLALQLLVDNEKLIHICASTYHVENSECSRAIACLDNILSGISINRARVEDYVGWGDLIALPGFISELRRWVDLGRKKMIKTQKIEPQGKAGQDEMDNIKDRFKFNEAQAFFDSKDLELPSGDTVSILEKLVDSFGEVVKHNILDEYSNPSNASDILKGRIQTIKKALKNYKIPCEIISKRGVGYVLQQTKTTSS